MKMVVVVGAGGLGREIADSLEALEVLGQAKLAGFVDDDSKSHTASSTYLGPVEAKNVPDDCKLILGVGDPLLRLSLLAKVGTDAQYTSVIHPSAVVSSSAQVGTGAFVAPFTYIGPQATIGDHAAINIFASVGHDAQLGALGVISPYATLSGSAIVGRGTFVASGAVIGVAVEVGEWSKVSMLAGVTRSCEPCSLVAGSPAKSRVMFRSPE